MYYWILEIVRLNWWVLVETNLIILINYTLNLEIQVFANNEYKFYIFTSSY